jgi:ribosome recycling factor
MKIEDFKNDFEKVIEYTKNDLSTIRTSGVSPNLIENIKVDVYGSPTPLMQVGNITSPEARQLLIEPWDKSTLKNIEKAIQTSSLGLSVVNEGTKIRAIMPAMTEETRKEVVKILNERIEKNRTALRGVRDDVKESVQAAEKSKEISEDERFSLLEELDKVTREYTEQVNKMGQAKEVEVMN